MPSLKAIRKRISTIKATQKITRAMKMVAGARLTRAQQRILALRPYALKTQEILAGLAAPPGAEGEDTVEEAARSPVLRRSTGAERGARGAHQRPRALRRVQHQHQQGRGAHVARAHRAGT